MVLAAWVKKRQFAEGVEVGKKQGLEQGKAQAHKRVNAKLREWAEEKGIPIEELPNIEDESNENPN